MIGLDRPDHGLVFGLMCAVSARKGKPAEGAAESENGPSVVSGWR